MTNLYPKYLRAIHKRICAVCTERTAEGACGLPLGTVCSIELHLPRIVDVVHSVESNMMKDYVPNLREHVCGQCPNQGTDGNCPLRKSVDCPLDRYFPLLVDAVEEVDESEAWPQCS